MSQSAESPSVYACIWRANQPFNQEEFGNRIPRLMVWLKDLKTKGALVACGGGDFADNAGGLTLVKANTREEAIQLQSGSPMNEIGTVEFMEWGVFYADLKVAREF